MSNYGQIVIKLYMFMSSSDSNIRCREALIAELMRIKSPFERKRLLNSAYLEYILSGHTQKPSKTVTFELDSTPHELPGKYVALMDEMLASGAMVISDPFAEKELYIPTSI